MYNVANVMLAAGVSTGSGWFLDDLVMTVNVKRFLTFGMLTAITLSFGICFERRAGATEWFDSYPKIPWKVETIRLKNLNSFLQNNPETIGCIIYQWTSTDDQKEMRGRAERARRYLIDNLKVDQSRILLIDGKQQSESQTIMELVRKAFPPPTF